MCTMAHESGFGKFRQGFASLWARKALGRRAGRPNARLCLAHFMAPLSLVIGTAPISASMPRSYAAMVLSFPAIMAGDLGPKRPDVRIELLSVWRDRCRNAEKTADGVTTALLNRLVTYFLLLWLGTPNTKRKKYHSCNHKWQVDHTPRGSSGRFNCLVRPNPKTHRVFNREQQIEHWY